MSTPSIRWIVLRCPDSRPNSKRKWSRRCWLTVSCEFQEPASNFPGFELDCYGKQGRIEYLPNNYPHDADVMVGNSAVETDPGLMEYYVCEQADDAIFCRSSTLRSKQMYGAMVPRVRIKRRRCRWEGVIPLQRQHSGMQRRRHSAALALSRIRHGIDKRQICRCTPFVHRGWPR